DIETAIDADIEIRMQGKRDEGLAAELLQRDSGWRGRSGPKAIDFLAGYRPLVWRSGSDTSGNGTDLKVIDPRCNVGDLGCQPRSLRQNNPVRRADKAVGWLVP